MQHHVDRGGYCKADARLVRRAHRPARVRAGLRKELVDAHALRIARARLQRLQDEQRHEHRARPVRNPRQVKREPPRQQHELDRNDRHGAPRQDAVECEQDAREDVDVAGAAGGMDRVARAAHVLGVR
jgi:hypothetical protein